jgi:hypothetical protein
MAGRSPDRPAEIRPAGVDVEEVEAAAVDREGIESRSRAVLSEQGRPCITGASRVQHLAAFGGIAGRGEQHG